MPAGPLAGVIAGEPLVTVAEGAEPMPLAVAWPLAALLLATAALVAWAGARATAGRLDRHRGVGIRTPRTVASEAAWRAAHQVAGPWLLGAAGAVGLPGLVLLARPSRALGTLLVLVGSGLLVSLVALGAILADRAAADATDGS